MLYWSIDDQQYCDSFRWTAEGVTHTYTSGVTNFASSVIWIQHDFMVRRAYSGASGDTEVNETAFVLKELQSCCHEKPRYKSLCHWADTRCHTHLRCWDSSAVGGERVGGMQICDGESARSPSWAAGVGGGRQRTEEGLSSDEFHDVVWGPEWAGSLSGCGPGWDVGTSDVQFCCWQGEGGGSVDCKTVRGLSSRNEREI